MKYVPFTTWVIEGTTVEEMSENAYDTVDEAVAELVDDYGNSDSYMGVVVYDDDGDFVRYLYSGEDFEVTSDGYRVFTEEEVKAIREAEEEYNRMLDEREMDDCDSCDDEDGGYCDEPWDIEVGFNPYMGDYDYDC